MRSAVTTVWADKDSPPLFTNCWVQRSRLTWNSHMLLRAVLPYPGGFRMTSLFPYMHVFPCRRWTRTCGRRERMICRHYLGWYMGVIGDLMAWLMGPRSAERDRIVYQNQRCQWYLVFFLLSFFFFFALPLLKINQKTDPIIQCRQSSYIYDGDGKSR